MQWLHDSIHKSRQYNHSMVTNYRVSYNTSHSIEKIKHKLKTRFFVEKKYERYRFTKHLSIIRNIPFEPMRNKVNYKICI